MVMAKRNTYCYSLGFTAFKISRLPQLKIETRKNGNLNVEPLSSL